MRTAQAERVPLCMFDIFLHNLLKSFESATHTIAALFSLSLYKAVSSLPQTVLFVSDTFY